MKFENNFTCFSWLLDFTSTVFQDELRQNQVISVKREAFTGDYSNLDQDSASARGKNVTSIAITTTSTTVIVNTNIRPQVQ